MVTAPVVIANTALTVSFDGSTSADSDDSIATYLWTFGDNQGATGSTTVTIKADGPDAQKAVEKLVALMAELE